MAIRTMFGVVRRLVSILVSFASIAFRSSNAERREEKEEEEEEVGQLANELSLIVTRGEAS